MMPSDNALETNDERPERYEVVFSEQAADDLRDATLALKRGGIAVASIERFADNFASEISSLAILPHRYEVFPRESLLLQIETRRLLYKSRSPNTSYHALYPIDEVEKRVTVVHIRNAVRRSMTRREAAEVLANQ